MASVNPLVVKLNPFVVSLSNHERIPNPSVRGEPVEP
jgi:hypothetical protein